MVSLREAFASQAFCSLGSLLPGLLERSLQDRGRSGGRFRRCGQWTADSGQFRLMPLERMNQVPHCILQRLEINGGKASETMR